jgi:RHS repeat-associated protein
VGSNPATYYAYDKDGQVYAWLIPGRGLGYVYMNGQILAQYENGTTYFHHHDHLGSTRLVTEMNQGTQQCMGYYPFGEEDANQCTPHVANNFNDALFTGKERDTESNLDNFEARYMASTLGRFMSPDPENAGAESTNPQSWNMYGYVLNNPLKFIDPTGTECVWDNGSFDAENDAQTGSVSGCQNAGGTWVELGQNGNWSGQANASLQNLVTDIQNGEIGSVTITTGGGRFTTNYDSTGRATQTITPNGSTIYSYSTPPLNSVPLTPLSSAVGVGVLTGEGACIILEPCGAGQAGALGVGLIVTGSALLVHNLHLKFSEQSIIDEVAREKGVDRDQLGRAVEQYKEGEGRGGDDNLDIGTIRTIADEIKAGGWWGAKK